MTSKTIIIPIGFNAKQCKRNIMAHFADDSPAEWMSDQDFVQQYLYCHEDGGYDPPIDVWLLVWDSPSNMVPTSHPNPEAKHCPSNTELKIEAIGASPLLCKTHHNNIRRHLIYIIPPGLNSTLYDLSDKQFLGVDDVHVIDMQAGIAKADQNIPLLDFLEGVDHRVAEMIAVPKATFDHCDTLVQYQIPESVTHIEDRAFASCKKLRKVTIPEAVERIGVNPFLRCRNLRVVSHSPRFVVENNMLIDKQTGHLISFFGDEIEVEVPACVEEIGNWAFGGCAHLQKVALPDTVTHIGESAFKGCRKLQGLRFPDSLLCIGEWAFFQCESFEEIHIPESVLHIGDWAFCGCKKLRKVLLPDKTALGEHVFAACERLEM